MHKYRFTVVFERELSHEEINELEMALAAQCEDYGPYVMQLLEAGTSETKSGDTSTGEAG